MHLVNNSVDYLFFILKEKYWRRSHRAFVSNKQKIKIKNKK